MTCNLRKETDDYARPCDGCGRQIPQGEPYLGCIDSCCGGGCYRSLCVDCVKAAATLMAADDWGRVTTSLMNAKQVEGNPS